MPPGLHLKEKKVTSVVNMSILNSHKTFTLLFSGQLNSVLLCPGV